MRNIGRFKCLQNFVCCKVLNISLTRSASTFRFSDLQITLATASEKKPIPDFNNLLFGKHFSDHMFTAEWTEDQGWGLPYISPLHDISLHPAAKVFHYAQELFEGMKAFRGPDGRTLLFRPDLNIKRMLATSKRAELPQFDSEEFLKCLKKLVSIDKTWVPNTKSSALYIRPTFIGTEASLGVASSKKALLYIITGPVGPYFKTGVQEPVSLFADPKYVRAWPGGVGNKKMGANYASTIYVQKQAEKQNLQQVLWLYGEDHQLTEVGTMNIFIFLINEQQEKELVTPPLNDIILPGVIRESLLSLAREWNEFKVSERLITMKEVLAALEQNRLLEMFGSGTACVVCPVKSINYMGKHIDIPVTKGENSLNHRFFQKLTDIQTGRCSSSWVVSVD